MAPPPMAPPTLTSATTNPREARNPWRRQRPQRTATPLTLPPPDGDYPQIKNSSTTNNQYTGRGTPPSPTPPRHLSHPHHRRRRGSHHPSSTAPSPPPPRPAHKRYAPTARNNTLTIDTTGNTTYAPYVTLAMLTNHHPRHQCPRHQRHQHHRRRRQRQQLTHQLTTINHSPTPTSSTLTPIPPSPTTPPAAQSSTPAPTPPSPPTSPPPPKGQGSRGTEPQSEHATTRTRRPPFRTPLRNTPPRFP